MTSNVKGLAELALREHTYRRYWLAASLVPILLVGRPAARLHPLAPWTGIGCRSSARSRGRINFPPPQASYEPLLVAQVIAIFPLVLFRSWSGSSRSESPRTRQLLRIQEFSEKSLAEMTRQQFDRNQSLAPARVKMHNIRELSSPSTRAVEPDPTTRFRGANRVGR